MQTQRQWRSQSHRVAGPNRTGQQLGFKLPVQSRFHFVTVATWRLASSQASGTQTPAMERNNNLSPIRSNGSRNDKEQQKFEATTKGERANVNGRLLSVEHPLGAGALARAGRVRNVCKKKVKAESQSISSTCTATGWLDGRLSLSLSLESIDQSIDQLICTGSSRHSWALILCLLLTAWAMPTGHCCSCLAAKLGAFGQIRRLADSN